MRWAESLGGADALRGRVDANYAVLQRWVEATPWVEFLASHPETQSRTSVCLSIVESWFVALPIEQRWRIVRNITAMLEQENAGYDIAAYRNAPPGLRIWCGATVEATDIERLTPWLDWAHAEIAARSN